MLLEEALQDEEEGDEQALVLDLDFADCLLRQQVAETPQHWADELRPWETQSPSAGPHPHQQCRERPAPCPRLTSSRPLGASWGISEARSSKSEVRAGKAPSDSSAPLAVWLQREGTAWSLSVLGERKTAAAKQRGLEMRNALPNHRKCSFCV